MKQLQKLNAYIGCGPHMDADIIVMGNEEGTGGYPEEIEAHTAARFRLYGKDEKTVDALLKAIETDPQVLHHDELHGEEAYTYCLNGDWENGFWEENDKDGEGKIERYIIARDGKLKKKVEVPPSPFLNYIARICLALDHRNEDKPLQDWFQKKNADLGIIDKYIKNHLFKKSVEGVKTALTDWRPLPRPNQDTWFEEYGLLGKSARQYMDAYFFNPNEREKAAYILAERRAELLKDLIVNSKARFLIMIGEVLESKLDLIKRFFPDQDIQFTRLKTRNHAYTITVKLPHKTFHIYAMPFFGNGALSLEELHRFVRDILLPDYTKQPRPQFEELMQKPTMEMESFSHKIKLSINGEVSPEIKLLKEVAVRLSSLEPNLRHGSFYSVTRDGFSYAHFWFDEEHWGDLHCDAHIHVTPNLDVEIRWGLYPAKIPEILVHSNLINAVDPIGNHLRTRGFKPSHTSKRKLFNKKINGLPQDELLERLVAETREMMNIVRGVLSSL
ncbi:hypothetical protein [Paenibacillus sp. Soil724D2]|uniref:hypothetical protein n=1 Tax=Paenibacillus sp. (strain Soil724D2) TaxID=1736392 RepID=UPI0012E3BD53|nr:hypothetical protein [Paenibacillus sp. Soil724D2]